MKCCYVAALSLARASCGGFALLEFLVALLIFSVGILLLLANQAAGARLTTGAVYRSAAVALASDLVTRVQLNPAQTARYTIDGPADTRLPPAVPALDCSTNNCQPWQFADFELWQWKRLLHGMSVVGADEGRVGGTGISLACAQRKGERFIVTLGWPSHPDDEQQPDYSCVEGELVLAGRPGSRPELVRVSLATWIPGARF